MLFKKKFFYIFIIALFLILGFIFRLKAFLFSRPLWLDECFLFHNIYSRNIFGYFSVLEYAQSAPPFFLILEKLLIYILGIDEKALRLIPFLCSVISLPIFYIFSKKFLKTHLALIIANALFAVNINCIYYAQELKQYSMDILCFMVLFMILNKITVENLNAKNMTVYCTATTIFPFFSITSYFLIGAWFFREILNHGKKFKKLIIVQFPMIILLCFYYVSTLSPQRQRILEISGEFWKQGFLSINPINDLRIIRDVILYYFCPCSFYLMLFILLLFGFFLLSKNYKNKEESFLINTVSIVILASICHIYPILERIVLFLITVFIIFVSKCIDLVSKDRKILSAIIIVTFLLSFHNYNLNYLKKCYKTDIWFSHFKSKTYPNSKEIVKFLIKNYKLTDIVIVNCFSKAEYTYYKIYYGLYPKKEIFIPYIDKGGGADYAKKFEDLTVKNKKYWIFSYSDCSKNQGPTKGYMSFIRKNRILMESNGLAYIERLK